MAKNLQLFTISEVAQILKVTERTIYNYLKNGSLIAAKVGKQWRVRACDLEMFIENSLTHI